MICYKDMTFCSRGCANKDCKRNKQNINKPSHLEWMPVAFSDFKDCKKYMAKKGERKIGEIKNEAVAE